MGSRGSLVLIEKLLSRQGQYIALTFVQSFLYSVSSISGQTAVQFQLLQAATDWLVDLPVGIPYHDSHVHWFHIGPIPYHHLPPEEQCGPAMDPVNVAGWPPVQPVQRLWICVRFLMAFISCRWIYIYTYYFKPVVKVIIKFVCGISFFAEICIFLVVENGGRLFKSLSLTTRFLLVNVTICW